MLIFTSLIPGLLALRNSRGTIAPFTVRVPGHGDGCVLRAVLDMTPSSQGLEPATFLEGFGSQQAGSKKSLNRAAAFSRRSATVAAGSLVAGSFQIALQAAFARLPADEPI